jgi:hypothetical protein
MATPSALRSEEAQLAEGQVPALCAKMAPPPPTGPLGLVTAKLSPRSLAPDQVLEGVDRHGRAGIPVAGPVSAILAIFPVGQLPAAGPHPVQ